MIDKLSRSEQVRTAYREILMREADESGLESYIKTGLSISEIKERLKSSKEYKDKIKPVAERINKSSGKKVLLFGAYGNNNLGDAIQAQFVLKGLREAGYHGEVWSTSYLEGHYHFPEEYKLPSWVIKSHGILEMFDMLIIGGGGLLSHPHYPLNDKEWAENLSIPTALLAVGATNFAAFESESLVKKACFVSARDEVSLRCLNQFKNDVKLLRDPVLCMQEYRKKEKVNEVVGRTAWILKGPLNAEVKALRKHVKPGDVVIGFEKKVDQDIEQLFPEIVYTPTVESFKNQMFGCSRAVSMRYHGLIMALPLVDAVYGLGDQKNESVLLDIGLSKGYCKNASYVEVAGEVNESLFDNLYDSRIKLYKKDFIRSVRSLVEDISKKGG